VKEKNQEGRKKERKTKKDDLARLNRTVLTKHNASFVFLKRLPWVYPFFGTQRVGSGHAVASNKPSSRFPTSSIPLRASGFPNATAYLNTLFVVVKV
jgi:hypothetical protein